MIDYIKGILAYKEIGHITVEANGVGYAITIPLSTYEKLPAVGCETFIYIHYHVREDGHKLFGFSTLEEREVFRDLIGVSKIGPKVAVNILSGIVWKELIECINRGDYLRLEKIPGVGAKTAQRLVMELKGKVGKLAIKGVPPPTITQKDNFSYPSIKEEVYAAMISLGYTDKQIIKAIEKVEAELKEEKLVEVWIRKLLQVI
ncbi:MAG: Holliday junction branch migration protein RuvA [Chitinispirillaceae bacterium]|nr:Holliday junction branch migration protein RuvA [Chitinispirillaceae bacterium]